MMACTTHCTSMILTCARLQHYSSLRNKQRIMIITHKGSLAYLEYQYFLQYQYFLVLFEWRLTQIGHMMSLAARGGEKLRIPNTKQHTH